MLFTLYMLYQTWGKLSTCMGCAWMHKIIQKVVVEPQMYWNIRTAVVQDTQLLCDTQQFRTHNYCVSWMASRDWKSKLYFWETSYLQNPQSRRCLSCSDDLLSCLNNTSKIQISHLKQLFSLRTTSSLVVELNTLRLLLAEPIWQLNEQITNPMECSVHCQAATHL